MNQSVDRLQVLFLKEAVLEGELFLLALSPNLVVEVDVRSLLVLIRDRLRLLVTANRKSLKEMFNVLL